jgi:hypothetical protein
LCALPVYLDCPLCCLSLSCVLCCQFIWIVHCFVCLLTQWTIQIDWQCTQDTGRG